MGRIRKVGVAVALATVMAIGFGTPLSAASKKGNTKSGGTCEYLTAIITYEYTSPTVMLYTLSLYSYYGCSSS